MAMISKWILGTFLGTFIIAITSPLFVPTYLLRSFFRARWTRFVVSARCRPRVFSAGDAKDGLIRKLARTGCRGGLTSHRLPQT